MTEADWLRTGVFRTGVNAMALFALAVVVALTPSDPSWWTPTISFAGVLAAFTILLSTTLELLRGLRGLASETGFSFRAGGGASE